jgi:hypothetical protein
MTKASVLEQVIILRDRIQHLANLTEEELRSEYRLSFQGFKPDEDSKMTRANMTRSLLIAATHYMTLVLNLE